MIKLKTVVIGCMLFAGMNQVQAQIGQIKSASSTILSKKPAKNKTKDTETKPETKTGTESPDQKPAENKTADAPKTAVSEATPETKPVTEPDTKTAENKTETKTADTLKTVTPPATAETKPVKQDPPLPKYSAIKAVMVNASLEKQAISVINQKATQEKWNERYTKAKITSQWDVVKSKSTGAILHRMIDLTLYGVWPNGECRATVFGFYQDYEGNGKYSSLRYNSIGGMKDLQCE